MRTPYPNELMHYGVIGMKWGVRRYQNPDGTLTAEGRRHLGRSASGNVHRVAAGIYNLNAKTYDKLGNKTLASMNKAAAKESLKKAEASDAKTQEKRAEKAELKQQKNTEKTEHKQRLKDVDPDLAKNKQTRRVALDYHNMSDVAFKMKYAGSKEKFAKRYEKSDGDTYSMGKRKAVLAAAIVAKSGPVPYIDLRNGGIKTIPMGKEVATKLLIKDIGYSEAVTRIGYNNAEEKYKKSN